MVVIDELTRLSNKYGSDKGNEVGAAHNYTPLYNFLFHPYRDKNIRFLEIGLLRGGPELGNSKDRKTYSPPSIRMWLDYFEEVQVIGYDICDFSEYQNENFTFFRGDAGNEADLQHFASSIGQIDIILDDGSHASFHQLKAFEMLFPKVKPGGFYIIEDLHWQPRAIEESLPKCPTTREFVGWVTQASGQVEMKFPQQLENIPKVCEEISYCHGFPSYRSGSNAMKTAVFHKAASK